MIASDHRALAKKAGPGAVGFEPTSTGLGIRGTGPCCATRPQGCDTESPHGFPLSAHLRSFGDRVGAPGQHDAESRKAGRAPSDRPYRVRPSARYRAAGPSLYRLLVVIAVGALVLFPPTPGRATRGGPGVPAEASSSAPAHPPSHAATTAGTSEGSGVTARTSLPLAVPNGSLGSVAFSWQLASRSVQSGAVNPRFPVTPDQLLYVPITRELWTAFATPGAGTPFATSILNLSNGASDSRIGVGNVTGFAYDPALSAVSAAEILPNGTGQVISFRAGSHEIARVPTPVGPHPTSLALSPGASTLWVTGWSNASVWGTVTLVSDTTGFVRAVLPVGRDPTVVAFDASANLAYVGNSGSNNISVLRVSDGSPAAAPIALPGSVVPGALAFDASSGMLVGLLQIGLGAVPWLFEMAPSASVPTLLARLPGNATASTIALDASRGAAYLVSDAVANSTAAGGVLYRWTFATSSWSVAGFAGRSADVQTFDPASSVDYVGHNGQTYVSAVNVSLANASPRLIEFGGGPGRGAFDPTDGRVYVVDSFRGGAAGTAPDVLEAISPASGAPAERISLAPPGAPSLDAGPVGVVDDPASARLFVADGGWSQASVLAASNGSYLGRIPLPFVPVATADDAARGVVYFASATGQVEGFHAANLTVAGQWNLTPPTVALQSPIEALAIDPSTGTVVVLVPDLGSAGVSGAWLLAPRNGSARFVPLASAGAGPLGDYPDAVTFDPLVGDAYVGMWQGSVEVVNVTNATVVRTVLPGSSVSDLTFDPGRGAVIGADPIGAAVFLLNASAPLSLGSATFGVGPYPRGVTIDTSLDQLLVSLYDSATVDAFSIVPEAGPLTVHVTIPTVGEYPGVTARDDVGRPVLIDALVGGGNGPDSLAYSGLPVGCASANLLHLFCQPTAAGNSNPSVTVTDQIGQTAAASTTLEVDPAPSLSERAAPRVIDGAGANITITVAVSGGNGPFRYTFGFGDASAPLNESTASASLAATHLYASPGRYNVTTFVTDAFGATADTTIPVVIGAPMRGEVHLLPSPSGASSGSFTMEADVTGGVGPFSFVWEIPQAGRIANGTPGGNRSAVTETFRGTGVQLVEVWANDSANGSLFLTLVVDVPPTSTTPSPPPPVWEIAVVGAVVLTAVFLLLWRRSRTRRAAKALAERGDR
jgi:DNA-binding beta-propeller fold protein YncE